MGGLARTTGEHFPARSDGHHSTIVALACLALKIKHVGVIPLDFNCTLNLRVSFLFSQHPVRVLM